MIKTYHFIAATHVGLTPLKDPELCAHLWRAFQERFPKAWACVLMPDHLHLVTEARDPLEVRRALATELRAAGRAFLPGKRIWPPLPAASLVPNTLHLKRTIRYVHLNPCRDGLARDPLEWEWSTHRDYLGLSTTGWIERKRAADLWGCQPQRLTQVVHAYVSGDPTVAIAGTPPPQKAAPGTPLAATPALCIQAVAAVSRVTPPVVRRRGPARDAAIRLACEIARNPPDEVALALGVHPQSIRRTLKRMQNSPEVDPIMQAARTYLGDPRCYKTQKG